MGSEMCIRDRFYHVQEINWTIITKEEMRAAESAGNLVIFQDFDPRL